MIGRMNGLVAGGGVVVMMVVQAGMSRGSAGFGVYKGLTKGFQ